MKIEEVSNINKRKSFKCGYCTVEAFSNNFLLIQHQLEHLHKLPFGCLICPKRFEIKEDLFIHHESHSIHSKHPFRQERGNDRRGQEERILNTNSNTNGEEKLVLTQHNSNNALIGHKKLNGIINNTTTQKRDEPSFKLEIESNYSYSPPILTPNEDIFANDEDDFPILMPILLKQTDFPLENNQTEPTIIKKENYNKVIKEITNKLEKPKRIIKKAIKNNNEKRKKLLEINNYILEISKDNFKCKSCGKYFKCKNIIRRHVKIHLNIFEHSCDNCKAKFRDRCVKIKHQEKCIKRIKVTQVKKSVKANAIRRIKVPQVKKSVKANAIRRIKAPQQAKKSVKEAKAIKNKQDEELDKYIVKLSKFRFQCKTCERFFGRIDVLRNHIKIHLNIFEFFCDFCDKGKFRQRIHKIKHEAKCIKSLQNNKSSEGTTIKPAQQTNKLSESEQVANKNKPSRTIRRSSLKCSLCSKRVLKEDIFNHLNICFDRCGIDNKWKSLICGEILQVSCEKIHFSFF